MLATPARFRHNPAMRPTLNRLRAWLSHPGWLPALFALATAPVLAFLCIAVPPSEVADEAAHIIRADSVRNGQAAGFRQPRLDHQGDPATDVVVRTDPSLVVAAMVFPPGTPAPAKQVAAARLDALLRLRWADRLETVSVPNTGVYPPLLYLPAAAGLQGAKWAGKGPYSAILFARLVNAAAYVALAAAAIHLARRGRAALFAVLCLPMSLALAASVNHDGLILAGAALAGALLTRPEPRPWWGGVGVLSVAAMAKPYLLPMLLLLPATVPGGWRRKPGRVAASLAVVALPALAWGVAMAVFVAAPFVRGPAQPAGPLWDGPPGTSFPTTNPGEQLRILLAAPTRFLTVPAESALAKADVLWREAVGVLGTLDLVLPPALYAAWGWALAASVLAGLVTRERRPGGATPAGLAAAAVLGALASAWCVYILQYLSWTRVGEALVDGVQGRYFLPIAILALPALVLPVLRLPGGAALRGALSTPAVLLAMAGWGILPWVVLRAYYVR